MISLCRMVSARVLPVGCLLLLASAASAAEVRAQVGPEGLASLKHGDVELLKAGQPRVERVWWGDGTTSVTPGNHRPNAWLDPAATRLEQKYDWGKAVWTYRLQAERLGISVTLTNTSDKPIQRFQLRPLQVEFPETPKGPGWYQGQHVTSAGIDDVAVVVAQYGAGALAAALSSPQPEAEVSLHRQGGQVSKAYDLRIATIARKASDFVHVDYPVLSPGQSVTLDCSLRFGPGGGGLKELAGDLFAAYAQRHPRVLKWPDRRPIAAIMLASGAPIHRSATNPRGWLNDPKLDVTTDAGCEVFRQRMLATAERSVKEVKSRNGQGVIVWNVEGEENPHPITYIGDPRLLPELAPEMDAVADAFFARFRDAGLKTGVCLRPSRVSKVTDPAAKAKWKHGHMGFDSATEIAAKIAYAKQRWGCTIFYLDTNITWAFSGEKDKDGKEKVVDWVMRADLLRRIAAAHPDVLLIPEFQHVGYYSHVSGYKELREHHFGGFASTPARVRLAYPEAFSLINVAEGKIDQRHAELVEAVRRGDILLFRGWFNSSENAKVQRIYEEAGAK